MKVMVNRGGTIALEIPSNIVRTELLGDFFPIAHVGATP
jgi:hypothetical protein